MSVFNMKSKKVLHNIYLNEQLHPLDKMVPQGKPFSSLNYRPLSFGKSETLKRITFLR